MSCGFKDLVGLYTALLAAGSFYIADSTVKTIIEKSEEEEADNDEGKYHYFFGLALFLMTLTAVSHRCLGGGRISCHLWIYGLCLPPPFAPLSFLFGNAVPTTPDVLILAHTVVRWTLLFPLLVLIVKTLAVIVGYVACKSCNFVPLKPR